MKGYSDGENLHVTFEREESTQLVFLLMIAKRRIMDLLEKEDNEKFREKLKKVLKETEEFMDKLSLIAHKFKDEASVMITEKIDKLYHSKKMPQKLWKAWLDLCLMLDGMELDERDRQLIDSQIEEILSLTYNLEEEFSNGR